MILHRSTMTETSVSKRLKWQLVTNEDFFSKLIVRNFNIFHYGEALQVSLLFPPLFQSLEGYRAGQYIFCILNLSR